MPADLAGATGVRRDAEAGSDGEESDGDLCRTGDCHPAFSQGKIRSGLISSGAGRRKTEDSIHTPARGVTQRCYLNPEHID